MVFAVSLLALASVADWVPMRWASADVKALEALTGTPVNCILLEQAHWSADLVRAAASRNIVTLGVIRPGAEDSAKQAADMKLTGLVMEGDFDPDALARLKSFATDSKLMAIELPSRAHMRFDASPVVGTYQGVWPGIQAEEEGKAHAAPSGAPWIHTNGGFLRFVRAAAPGATVWLANRPDPGSVFPAERYMQAISDAAIIGARWVIALDDDVSKQVYSGNERAVAEWKKIAAHVAWYESHREWRAMKPLSQLAIVQDSGSGALFSGGVLDMIAVKHTPVLPVPAGKLSPETMAEAKLAVNVSPGSLSDAQRETLRGFARRGGTLLSGPATWKFPAVASDRITLSEDDVRTLDEIWKEMNNMTGRRNLGARLFNVSSMLSNLTQSDDGKTAQLHLVNYSGYPVENVTVHLLGKYRSARLLAPGKPDQKLELYPNDEGTGVDIASVGVAATMVLEAQ